MPATLTAADAATVTRVLSLQLDALITEYGAPIVLHALASSLQSASYAASGSHRYQRAGTYNAIASALNDAAVTLAEIGRTPVTNYTRRS